MKKYNWFKEFVSDVGFAVRSAVTVTFFLLVLIGVFGILLRPVYLAADREAVEQSKSFIDSSNMAIDELRLEYGRLAIDAVESNDSAVYEAQMAAIVNNACNRASMVGYGNLTTLNELWIKEKCE